MPNLRILKVLGMTPEDWGKIAHNEQRVAELRAEAAKLIADEDRTAKGGIHERLDDHEKRLRKLEKG